MSRRFVTTFVLAVAGLTALNAAAQSFRVQCPTSTITHPNAANNNSEPAYSGPTSFATNAQGYVVPSAKIKKALSLQ